MVFQGWEKGLSQGWICSGFISIEQGEWEDFSGAMRNGVMMKLSGGEEVHPFLGVIGTEDMKICFDLLIGSFGLSISLWVVCSGELDIIVEESS